MGKRKPVHKGKKARDKHNYAEHMAFFHGQQKPAEGSPAEEASESPAQEAAESGA